MLVFARYAFVCVAVLVMSVYIPQCFDLAVGQRVAKSHLFYSPVSEKFIWRDTLLEPPPSAKEGMHHALFLQMDQDGQTYDRQEFEKQLPFIYFKNMELWGMLPLQLQGKSFDKETIKKNRQVIELTPRMIAGRSPDDTVHPLLESAPDSVNLVFPEERFRLGKEMEFINADYNTRDEGLTETFTTALKDAGFEFPGRLAAGKETILKPFDEGFFLVDAAGALFHIKRVKGKPQVIRTPVDPAIGIRSLRVSENSRRDFYGLLLTGDDQLYVLTYDNYALRHLPLQDYDPDRMDFKMIINPLYRTAVYSDDAVIRAVVMDSDYQPVARYSHRMPGAERTTAEIVLSFLVPFRINLADPTSGYVTLAFQSFGWHSLAALLGALLLYGLLALERHTRGKALWLDGALVLCTGLYGLLTVLFLPLED